MQPLTKERLERASTVSRRSHPALLTFVALGIGIAAFGLLFLPEIKAAVSTWNTSTAYGHCYLVLPMALYLLWDRRDVAASVPARAEPALALLALPIAAAWLAAERLGIMEGRQLMAVAGLEVLLLTVLGRRLFWALSGPLLYLFFLVPFGAFVTPWLQHFTARFSEVGLNLLGIPNYTDDLIIEISAGTFFVAEACAGLRFLIAAIAFGVFYALLNYRSPARRAAFIAASVVVPIVANGFRALGIVVLGHILGSAEAAAADHVVYGWIFFSIVMLLLVAAGMPLREPAIDQPAPASMAWPRSDLSAIVGAVVVLAAVALGPAIAALMNTRAVAGPLASAPELRMASGCTLAEPGPAGPAIRADYKVRCDGYPLDVSIEAFPARSTSSSLLAKRRAITGELEAEDTSITPLLSGGGQGNWTLVQAVDPYRTTAIASWARGQPAPTGLAGRLAQARDSVLGGDHVPVLMTVSASQTHRPSPEQQSRFVAALKKLIEAQTGLTAQIESLSRRR